METATKPTKISSRGQATKDDETARQQRHSAAQTHALAFTAVYVTFTIQHIQLRTLHLQQVIYNGIGYMYNKIFTAAYVTFTTTLLQRRTLHLQQHFYNGVRYMYNKTFTATYATCTTKY